MLRISRSEQAAFDLCGGGPGEAASPGREGFAEAVRGVNEGKQVRAVGGALAGLDDRGRLGDKLLWAPGVWNRRVMRAGPRAEVMAGLSQT